MILLNILGFRLKLSSNDDNILSRIKMDFEYFLDDSIKNFNNIQLTVQAEVVPVISPTIIPKNLKPLFQRQNSITYEQNGIRYNDYYGAVTSVFNATKGEALVIGIDLEKLYEVTYLLILSRSGKFLDLAGMHKIHAFSVVQNGKGIVCMQPMRGGKSTLFTKILLNYDVEIGSDDTPLINQDGVLLPFPLRVSLDTIPENLSLTEKDFYLMKREFFKAKFSLSLRKFEKKISTECSQFVFVEAHRSTFDDPQIVKMSRLRLFQRLFHHMVIGFGLPIIFEYFWESGRKDFFIKTKIFMKRFTLALKLTFTKDGYDFYLCNDSQKNAEAILKLIK
ncbi:MAG: hypothetical protein PHY93_12910 [Bacteriovorax sp.]|nr:hypothetical protein [Bacteriovorax sp.]